ncbi:hypothetical protein DL95DRAFT_399444 [Leptodontidium sp. 2 PMI_412]|nr:hypothetical protein DL95DRAFT_399444 [Leptodontidium sp. 2 PMI_412]
MDYQQSNKRPISPVNNGEEHVKRGRLSLSDSILPEVALSEDTCLYPGQSPMHDNVKALLSDNAHETLRNAVPVIGNDHEECASPLIGVSENLSNLHDMVIDAEDLFQTVPRYSNPAGEAESNGGDISTGRLGVEATVKAREPSVESTANSVITTADLDQDMCTLSRTCAMEHSQNPR